MVGAGKLDRRLQFSERVEVDDGYGNTVGAFVPQFSDAANIKFLKGGESVMAARLTANGPVIVTVRNSTQTRRIAPQWQAQDTRTGVVYNIRERPRESDDRSTLEFLAESGVAV